MSAQQQPSIEWLEAQAKSARVQTIDSIYLAKSGHAGTSLSMIEVLVALYFAVLCHHPSDPDWPERDRVVLSKGHGAPGLYAVLSLVGYFETADLSRLRKFGSLLQGHPKKGLAGVDVSTGSLGQGLSVATGIGLGLRLRGSSGRVFCILGDGEMQEGQNWEAMMSAAAWGLENVVAIIDRNQLQNDGRTEDIIPIEDLVAKGNSFGWSTSRVDGNDMKSIVEALRATSGATKPTMIVADTVKGKGVSFMENVVKWHHHPINLEEYKLAIAELRGDT